MYICIYEFQVIECGSSLGALVESCKDMTTATFHRVEEDGGHEWLVSRTDGEWMLHTGLTCEELPLLLGINEDMDSEIRCRLTEPKGRD